eukprot:RCo026687
MVTPIEGVEVLLAGRVEVVQGRAVVAGDAVAAVRGLREVHAAAADQPAPAAVEEQGVLTAVVQPYPQPLTELRQQAVDNSLVLQLLCDKHQLCQPGNHSACAVGVQHTPGHLDRQFHRLLLQCGVQRNPLPMVRGSHPRQRLPGQRQHPPTAHHRSGVSRQPAVSPDPNLGHHSELSCLLLAVRGSELRDVPKSELSHVMRQGKLQGWGQAHGRGAVGPGLLHNPVDLSVQQLMEGADGDCGGGDEGVRGEVQGGPVGLQVGVRGVGGGAVRGDQAGLGGLSACGAVVHDRQPDHSAEAVLRPEQPQRRGLAVQRGVRGHVHRPQRV